jgi:DNA-binding protein H-NS
MTKTYAQVMKQIDGLKSEAERLRRQEVDGVIGRIRDAIRHYGLTAADLGLARGRSEANGPARKTRGPRKAKAAAAGSAPKYRDDQGRSWVGRGKRPQWLRDALAAGKTLEDFMVK